MRTFLASLAVAALLAAGAAEAGPLAPQPRVVAKYERDFIERTGSQTLEELLNTGIVRYFLTGGQPLLVLVNGRPYFSTSSDLDPLPVSAIERIEILGGESLGTLGGSAVRGALNVVLRSDLDGFEARTVTRAPSRDGGDGWQGSVFWGGEIGKGRMTLGMDVLDRQEIAAKSRDYSRSAWKEGGSFGEAKNVSLGGNTVYILQRDDADDVTGLRSVALGECDPAKGYTGPLSNPPGITNGDKGCGFAYGRIMWNSDSYEQRSVILNLDHPLGEDADFHMDANITQSESAFRYAPSVGTFAFSLTNEGGTVANEGLLAAINNADPSVEADGNDIFVAGHRFVRHGNRNWLTDIEEYDLSASVEGSLADGLGYDARIDIYRLDGSLDGRTFVHEDTIASKIREGSYILQDPFLDNGNYDRADIDNHLQAIEDSSLRLETDFGQDWLGARLALEGDGFAIGGRNAAWTAGVELARDKAHVRYAYRANDGASYDSFEVLGTGGSDFAGRRTAAAAFAETVLPVAEDLDIRVAGRGNDLDDVGGLGSWSLGAEYRASGLVTLRGSWSAGERAPSFLALHGSTQDHPYIDCDPGGGAPPRTCESNPRQVSRETGGDPKLDPWNTARLAVGAEFRRRPYFLGVEWYRLSLSDVPGQNRADWSMRNLPLCGAGLTTDCIDRTGGDITIRGSYANVVDTEVSGVNVRFGAGMRTSWGVVGMRGTWRHVADAELRIQGTEDRYVIPRNAVRVGFLARRGSLSAIWTANYRSGFRNSAGTGTFDSWTGHDLVLDWKGLPGLEGARVAAGVFNLTDEPLSVDTSNPQSVDGPTAAGWGRTFFLTMNMRF